MDDKVNLRPLRLADAAQVLQWRNMPDVARFMYGDHRITEAEHVGWMERTVVHPDRKYWIINTEGLDVGLAGLTEIERKNSRAEWAFYLGHPGLRGRGVGAVVEFAVTAYAFEVIGLHKLCCEVFVWNQPIVRMHEKFGFVREGVLRQHVRKDGQFHDIVRFGLLKAEWPVAREKALQRLARVGIATETLPVLGEA
jgi:UDP-4-amino-4,6-dideoxy-N-acetyl-beta-L-altrosamine N-acetyltransferase